MEGKMIRAIIIDDEPKSRETITEMLSLYCKNVQVVAQAEDVKSGIQQIKSHNPDLILLDIKMPDGTGFDLLRQISRINFKIIFITAYEEYAIKAFKFSALDYILKPIDPSELVTAIERSDLLIEKDNINLKLDAFLNNFQNGNRREEKRIILKTSDSIHLVDISDIIRCESDRNYTQFFLRDGEKILVSKSIKEYTELLEDYGFFRVHQSHMANLYHLKRYDKEDCICIMSDNSRVPVSYRKKEDLMKQFKYL